MFRPTQPELIAKRLPNIELNFVASNDYLKKHGQPKNLQEIAHHTLIGYDKDPQFIKAIKHLGFPVSEKDFYLKTDFLPLQIELARNGAGITITHKHLIQQWHEFNIIMSEVTLPHLEFWLVCHADVQHNRRIRVLMNFLTTYFEDLLS